MSALGELSERSEFSPWADALRKTPGPLVPLKARNRPPPQADTRRGEQGKPSHLHTKKPLAASLKAARDE